MDDKEKVIKGLECHVGLQCNDCPYVDSIHPAYGCHLEELISDALALLKEQEPRVLTLDEAVDGNYCYYVEFRYHLDCGWVKCDFGKMYLNGEVAMLFLRDKTFYQQREHYGKLWRLWNKQPTYEQKMETKWE